ncbi:hypothetical protein [Streptomyces sp. NPDC013455]|uniref:hypothetical protein n=1 Tax=Streptomyces sp. NPDC013455 TaxID=3155605 RepID=UPI0033C576A4
MVRTLVDVVLRTLGADHVVQAGGNVALPLLAAGERGQARQVFQASRAAATKIGFADAVDQLDELLKATGDGN